MFQQIFEELYLFETNEALMQFRAKLTVDHVHLKAL